MQGKDIRNLLDKLMDQSLFWSRFKGSEFYEYLANFIVQIFYRNRQTLEVRLMEGHVSQAQRPASIRAHAQDRGYIPLKRIPSKHTALFANRTNHNVSIPAHTVFTSGSNNLQYLNVNAFLVEPYRSIEAEIIQAEKVTITDEVNDAKKFYEVLLDSLTSKKLSEFSVFVTNPITKDRREWKQTHLFRNANRDDEVFVELSTALGEVGFMFGDGRASGKIPEIGSTIEVECLITEGFTNIPPEQELVCDSDYVTESLTITTGATLVVGSEREDTESIRKNLQYFTIYDGNTVWDEDYIFFVKHSLRGLTFLRVWGEAEQEILAGAKKVEHINKIYICAYHPNIPRSDATVAINDICNKLNSNALNKNHVRVEPKLNAYTVNLSGRTLSSRRLEDVEIAIKDALKSFSQRDKSHDGKATNDGIWRAIDALGLLTEYNITSSERLDIKNPIDTFRFLDVENSTVSITY